MVGHIKIQLGTSTVGADLDCTELRGSVYKRIDASYYS